MQIQSRCIVQVHRCIGGGAELLQSQEVQGCSRCKVQGAAEEVHRCIGEEV